MLTYSRHCLSDQDIATVVEVLQSDWLTTGPKVNEFERAFADFVGAGDAVAVSSGTAALHAAMNALEVGPGDEVIVPTMTFAATANAVVYQGATPVFSDVVPETLLIDPNSIVQKLNSRTRAIVAVDYAGQPCDYDRLQDLADAHNIDLVADACHSLGGEFDGRAVGSLAKLNAFSFHPVKPMTTGEGGMVTTDDKELARRMRAFRNHGITSDHRQRQAEGTWHYQMTTLGFNYRLSDFQCALGLSQLRRVRDFTARRNEIAAQYDEALRSLPEFCPLHVQPRRTHAYHLYVVRWCGEERTGIGRGEIFQALRSAGIGVNVHYVPVHLHAYYRQNYGTTTGMCPVAEAAYEQILSLPIHPLMSDSDVALVVDLMDQLRQHTQAA